MAEDIIQIPPDSTGKMLRAIKRTVGTAEVYEKTILVAEPISGVIIDPRYVTVQSGNVIAEVSGQLIIAQISGESVVSEISGQRVVSEISGQIVIGKVSGEIVIGKISGEIVGLSSGAGPIIAKISGETIRALSSGETYIAKVSGEVIIGKVSGETVIAKVSGEIVIGKVSGEVVSIYGYSKDIVSGAVIRNIKSGACVLHTVTVNDYTSGFAARIRDASSGAAGTIIAAIFAPTRALGPGTLIFDCVMLSGIVVDTSGATWHLTVTYR